MELLILEIIPQISIWPPEKIGARCVLIYISVFLNEWKLQKSSCGKEKTKYVQMPANWMRGKVHS